MDQAQTAGARPDRLGSLRADVRVGAYLVLLSAIVGLIVGLIWSVIAPRAEIVVFEGKLGVDNFSAGYIGADMTYGLLVAGAGLLVAAVAIWRWRAQPLGVLVGAVIGGIVGAALALRLGVHLAGGLTDAGGFDTSGLANGTVFESPLELRSKGAMLMWPLVSAFAITVFYSVAGSRLRRSLLRRYYGSPAPMTSQPHAD
ncbi:MAG: hypothetical protein ACOYD0_01650 [Candidatus Nanopelagicales bacterium]